MAQSLCVLALLGAAVFVCCVQFSLVSGACAGGVAGALGAASPNANGATALVGTEPAPACKPCCDIECPYGLGGLLSIITGIPNHAVCGLVCGCQCTDGATKSCSNPCSFSVCETLCSGCKCKAKTCPTGWSNYKGNCYKFFPSALSQDAAEASCVTNGGHLASVHDQAENEHIGTIVIPAQHIWLGMEIGHQGADWHITCAQNTDGSPADYAANPQVQGVYPWCSVQWTSPGNPGGDSFCVKAHPDGPGADKNCWNDWKCYWALPYVCKKPAACA